LRVFTDASMCPKTASGVGAYLIVYENEPVGLVDESRVQRKEFNNTRSTRLELQTLLWALSDLDCSIRKIEVFTDCQNILNLPGRRDRLEASNYIAKNNRQLTNADLYQQFYQYMDQLECTITKVKGHKSAAQRNDNDRLFAMVDKAARKALRARKVRVQ